MNLPARGRTEPSSEKHIRLESVVVPAGSTDPETSPPESFAWQRPATASDALVEILVQLGVTHAFGLLGGAIVPFSVALARSPIEFMHFRHESGAAFAAIEASLATGRPVVMVTTTGPGLTNAITGMVAARWEGAKVILISASTSAPSRGRGAFQETTSATFPASGLFTAGPFFHFAVGLESAAEIEVVASRLASGVRRPGGFVAHVSIPIAIQGAPCDASPRFVTASLRPPACDLDAATECAQLLSEASFAIWVGFGARDAAEPIRRLAERTGAMVMCSPRGKGIFPEDHPQFLGVTGLGGHPAVDAFFEKRAPARVLVLGTRLGEFTSFWSKTLVPPKGFIHVDVDPEAFGAAYPAAETLGVQAEVGAFVTAVLDALPSTLRVRRLPLRRVQSEAASLPPFQRHEPVRPSVLMAAIQRFIVEGTEGIVMTEAGNSFALGSHYLRFRTPGRYRVSTGFGSMGHATAGVVGAALATGKKAFALVGDGSMLMQNEISTAVQYRANAVWIVLNDAKYNMIHQGMTHSGHEPLETDIPRTDFVAIARGMGADGVHVTDEAELEVAITLALHARGPFLVDVSIDATELAPFLARVRFLVEQERSLAGGSS
jgi:acetolactate synthase-1/2/3 large subunit